MKQERIFIGGGMDTDSAIEYIDQKDYISAWNIRTTGTDGQELGYVTAIEGTEIIPYVLPSGLNKCVGGAVFRELRKAYCFIWNASRRHLVLEYNFDTNSLSKVFQNLDDSGGNDILQLDPAKYVTDINIINGVMYFLPSSRIPSRISIEDFKSGTLGIVQHQDLMLIKSKPLGIATASTVNDPYKDANLLENKIVKFSFQHIYKENEESVFAEPSKAYSAPIVNNTSATPPFNSMIVNIPVPDNRVETVAVIANINNNAQWVEIKRIDREDILAITDTTINLTANPQITEAYNNGVYSFVFYNDGLYPPVDTQLTNLEYDRVPDYAEAQELLNGNILAYMNIKEGRKTPDVDVSVNVSYTDKIAQQGQTDGDALVVTGVDSELRSATGPRYRLHFRFKGVVKTGDVIKLYVKDGGTNQPSAYYEYTVPLAYNNNTGGALNDFANTGTGFYSTPNVYDLGGGNWDFSFVSFVRDVADRAEVVLSNQSTSSFTSLSALKLNSNRQYGILYEYPYGKVSGVATNDRMVAKTDSYGTTHGSSPVVTLTINNTPPEGAVGYYIVSSGQLTHQKSVYMVGKILPSEGAQDQMVFDVTSLLKFNEDHESSVINYSLTKGDRASFALFESGGSPTYFDGNGTPKQDLLVTGFEADDDGNGNITYKLKVQKGQLDTLNLSGKNVLIEVYTPKLQSQDDNLFYTIGERYDIINGQHSVTNIKIDTGEVYVKTRQYRNPQDYNDFNTYVVEDFNYSDFEDTVVTDLGRPYLYNKDFDEMHLKAHIRYGDVFNESTGFNQLNRFKSENIYGNANGQTTEKYGEGMKMRQRGSSLIIFQELEVGYIPVNTTIYEDVTGQSNVAVSDKLLNNIRYNGQGIGIGKAVKSFAENDGEYYFVDPNKSQPVKVDRGGVRFITGRMSKFFQRLLQSTKRDIIGFFNDFYREYSISVESESGMVTQIPLTLLDWDTDNYSVEPNQITITQPVNGEVSYNNITGIATYTPDTDYVGDDPFTFSFGSVTRNVCLSVEQGDAEPDPFSFIDQVGVPISSSIESNYITPEGVNIPTTISIVGGDYTIDDGNTWTSSNGTIPPYQRVKVRQTSSASYGTTNTTTLTIGGQSGSFNITTVFGNDLRSGSATKNDCVSGSGTTVTYIVPADTYFASTKALANTMAQQDVDDNKQAYANGNGNCVTSSDYTIGLYEEQPSGSGTIIQVYAELRDENNSPINATIDILSEGSWIKREISTGEETGVSSPINLTTGNSRVNMFTYDATIEEIFGYAVSDVNPNVMDGHNIIGI